MTSSRIYSARYFPGDKSMPSLSIAFTISSRMRGKAIASWYAMVGMMKAAFCECLYEKKKVAASLFAAFISSAIVNAIDIFTTAAETVEPDIRGVTLVEDLCYALPKSNAGIFHAS